MLRNYIENLSAFRNAGLFTALAAVWGTSFIAIKVGTASVPPVLFAALRYDLASAALLAVVAVRAGTRDGFQWRPRSRDDWLTVLVGGVLVIGVHFALLFVGQSYVTSGVAAVVMSLLPVVTPAFAVPILGARLRRTELAGVGVGLLGVVVVANPAPGSIDGTAVGVGLLFLSAVAFALGTVLTTRLDAALPATTTQAWMMALGAAILHAISAALPGESVAAAALSPSVLAALAYLSLAASVGGFLAYFHLMAELGPSETSLVNYVVPVFAAVGGWAALGESIPATTVVGFLVIAAGFALLKLHALRAAVRKAVAPTPERTAAKRQASGSGNAVVVRDNVYYKEME